MNQIKHFIALALLLLLPIGCTDNSNTGANNDLVAVQFDLLDGFAGRMVSIELNGVHSFSASLPTAVPFAGPMASFTTELPRGLNQFEVTCSGGSGMMTDTHEHSYEFQLGDADHYYFALDGNMAMDSLFVVMQDSMFFYL